MWGGGSLQQDYLQAHREQDESTCQLEQCGWQQVLSDLETFPRPDHVLPRHAVLQEAQTPVLFVQGQGAPEKQHQAMQAELRIQVDVWLCLRRRSGWPNRPSRGKSDGSRWVSIDGVLALSFHPSACDQQVTNMWQLLRVSNCYKCAIITSIHNA